MRPAESAVIHWGSTPVCWADKVAIAAKASMTLVRPARMSEGIERFGLVGIFLWLAVMYAGSSRMYPSRIRSR